MQRLEFAPPQQPGFVRAFGLAIMAHAVLMAALTWGVNWRREAPPLTVEAELWAQVPVQSAPRPAEEPPAPPPAIATPVAEPPTVQAPDIVTQREKQRAADDKKREEEKQARLDKQAADKKLADQKKKQDEQKALDAARLKTEQAKLKAKEDEAKRREAAVSRMKELAGASGTASATGTAQQSAGPSASYQGRIQARIYPNIVFTEDISSNPVALVEVRAAPDGTITSRKLLKSSGVASWDEAVLKAIDKTEVLPRDVDGRVPSPLEIGFRPKK